VVSKSIFSEKDVGGGLSIIHVSELSDIMKTQVIHLWNKEYPTVVLFSDEKAFDKYTLQLSQLEYLLLVKDDVLIGWLSLFVRDNEQFFAIIVDSDHQQNGYGKLLTDEAKSKRSILHGWVVNHNE